MSTESPNLTSVTPEDVALLVRELEKTSKPLALKELVAKLAFEKTAAQRSQDVKTYDPYGRYEVGDFIYKEYDEPLTVGSKAVEHFSGGIVLKIVAKTYSKHFDCEMLEVDYPGGGLFRKYLDYMKKTRTQVLLPSNIEGRGVSPEIMAKDDDPRLTELPMTERDLRNLEKRLGSELAKNPQFFNWNDLWQLVSKRIDIPDETIRTVATHFSETQRSASTEELVQKLFGLEPSHDLFELTCLSLDYSLDKKHKKEFILLTAIGWGKWHLKKALNALPEGLPLSAEKAAVPDFEEPEKPELSSVQAFPIKIYLSWREILSGGVRIPRTLNKELSKSREYAFVDSEDGRSYTLYYYPTLHFFLGLRDFYKEHNIPQGTSLTLEKSGPNTFNFWIKKSKKKIAVPCLTYDVESDEIRDTGEEVFSFSEPNKIIYIDRETLLHLLSLAEQRNSLDLRELLTLIFKDSVLATTSHALHFLRAYHLVDLIRPTTQEDVELTLLNSENFSKSEKKKGIFFYEEPLPPKEEAPAEVPFGEFPLPVQPEEIGAEEGLVDELGLESGEPLLSEIETPEPPPPLPPRREKDKAQPPAAKKEKPPKKKKPRPEGERGPRPRKSERRVIEEKIEEEESVLAALSAIKEKEEEIAEVGVKEKKEKKEEFKPAPKKEEPKFGVFAEMLKSALKKKDEKKPDEDDS
jgi:hypothetical protein